MRFHDRGEAGRRLAAELQQLRGEDVVVLGLPRGGVPVAFEVARALEVPLDVIVVRKLGVPFQPELAMGAIGERDVLVLNEPVVRRAHVSAAEFAEIERLARFEVERRATRFRQDRPPVEVAGRTAVLVDDGIATGATARAACEVVKELGAARVVLAVPVCSPDAVTRLEGAADELVCLQTPEWFFGVGQFYDDFRQIPDEEVVELLRRAASAAPVGAAAATVAADPATVDEYVELPVGRVRLAGHLTVPEAADGVIVFAHGSGSSRHSPRNRYVAGVLHRAGLGTLLFDLLTPQEELHRANVFDVELLAGRLAEVTAWLQRRPDCRALPVGFFGASTGAAAALWAAATPGADIAAVVSRGGRPDLAAPRLPEVRAPTLLIVGEQDTLVLELNRRAQALMRCRTQLAVIPGATHLFEEPGTLELAAAQACAWFADHVSRADRPRV